MISLTMDERKVYQTKFVAVVPYMVSGIYSIKDFFGTEPSVPRIARRFYEDVVAGKFNNVSLAGTRSCDGYVIK